MEVRATRAPCTSVSISGTRSSSRIALLDPQLLRGGFHEDDHNAFANRLRLDGLNEVADLDRVAAKDDRAGKVHAERVSGRPPVLAFHSSSSIESSCSRSRPLLRADLNALIVVAHT